MIERNWVVKYLFTRWLFWSQVLAFLRTWYCSMHSTRFRFKTSKLLFTLLISSTKFSKLDSSSRVSFALGADGISVHSTTVIDDFFISSSKRRSFLSISSHLRISVTCLRWYCVTLKILHMRNIKNFFVCRMRMAKVLHILSYFTKSFSTRTIL